MKRPTGMPPSLERDIEGLEVLVVLYLRFAAWCFRAVDKLGQRR